VCQDVVVWCLFDVFFFFLGMLCFCQFYGPMVAFFLFALFVLCLATICVVCVVAVVVCFLFASC
jgi:ABC-type transport system involved in multi-copper enzyme maturation permease subunit